MNFVLLWSKRQNCFHIEPTERMLSINREAYRDNKSGNDYIPIAIGTKGEMHEMADSLRGTITARERARRELADA
jgi:hypothetical protein